MSKNKKQKGEESVTIEPHYFVVPEGEYDPMNGQQFSTLDYMVELSKGGFDLAERILDDMMLVSVEKAHANSLEVFKDSFGVNHTLDSGNLGVAWVGRIWDRNNQDEKIKF